MSYMTQQQKIELETIGVSWRNLYRVGGIATLVTVVLIVVGVVTFVIWPPPPPEASVTEWFALFQKNWFVAMLDLDLVMLISYIALIPVLLALTVALWRSSPTLMTLAAAFGLVGIATYFASSRVFEMLALSRQYATATAANREALVAAGQSMLSTYLGAFAAPMPFVTWNYQGTAFNISFVFWCVACLLIAVVMWRHEQFGKLIGAVGIVGYVTTLGLFAPVVGVYLSLVGLVLQLLWYSLVARALFRLAVGAVTGAQQPGGAGRPAALPAR